MACSLLLSRGPKFTSGPGNLAEATCRAALSSAIGVALALWPLLLRPKDKIRRSTWHWMLAIRRSDSLCFHFAPGNASTWRSTASKVGKRATLESPKITHFWEMVKLQSPSLLGVDKCRVGRRWTGGWELSRMPFRLSRGQPLPLEEQIQLPVGQIHQGRQGRWMRLGENERGCCRGLKTNQPRSGRWAGIALMVGSGSFVFWNIRFK